MSAHDHTHRIIAPTRALAQALATLITEEGYPATVLDTIGGRTAVLAHCPGEVLSSACSVVSLGNPPHTKRYHVSHYARAARAEVGQ